MTGLIIEGPDGSGKTTTAEFLSSAVGLPLVHSGGPPKSHKEIFNRALKQTQDDGKIFDRSVILTDMVYSPIIRNEELFEFHWISQIRFPVIYCRPSRKTIMKHKLREKPYKNEDHIRKVVTNLNRIISAYDELMQYVSIYVHVHHFDRDRMSLEELLPCAESILSRVEKTSSR